jgi:TnpA family transposase
MKITLNQEEYSQLLKHQKVELSRGRKTITICRYLLDSEIFGEGHE